MLKVKLLAVGKLKEPVWSQAQMDFLKRLKPLSKIEVIEVAPESTTATSGPERSMRMEGERLMGRIGDADYVIALERTGKDTGSVEFSRLLHDEGDAGRTLTLVIGGSEGLDDAVLKRANRKISLSKMTFTHEMARVFLLEQVYRAILIRAGNPYHK